VFSIVERGRRWLLETSWSYLLGLAFFLTAVTIMLSLGAHAGTPRAALPGVANKLILLVMLAKMAADYAGLTRFRAATAKRAPWPERLRALAPRLLLGWPALEAANLRSCLNWALRRPQPPRPAGTVISFLEKSSHSTMIYFGLISVCIELPMHTLIVSVMTKDPSLQHTLQVILGALAAYSLMWICGDRHAMAGSALVVDADALHLTIANRFAARIPLSAITRCEALGQGADAWCKRHAVSPRSTLTATPADFPNVVIGIDPHAGIELTSWQVRQAAPEYLFLFVDQPSLLAAALLQKDTND
jgi:hypothetical protein